MTDKFDLKGSIVALITPFHEDGSINFEKLEELLEFHIANKTDGILILGTTSESPTFTWEEDFEIVKKSVDVCKGRIPLIVNAGSNDTRTSFEKAERFTKAGADALLCISPYYNKANKAGLYHHIYDVADSVDIPVIIYNIPGRTGIGFPIDVMAELAKKDNIVGVKEASGDMGYVVKLANATRDHEFHIWSGNDDITIPLMSVGGSGAISVWANLMPEKVHEMCWDYLEGRTAKAAQTQLDFLPLINDFFIEVNPIPIKEAMNMAGMDVGGFRLPLYEMEEKNRAVLRAEMQRLGLI